MPLQIRRGPSNDRLDMNPVPLEGELIYDTDEGAVYIGDGTTAGGIKVTSYSPDDARANVVQMFLGGSGTTGTDNSIHSGVTFQYVGNRLVTTIIPDLSNHTGLIVSDQGFKGNLWGNDSGIAFNGETGTFTGQFVGDIKGSLFADDSTELVSGSDGTFNLDGTVATDVIPTENSVYSLGSASNRFKDLYLSGTTIYLGDVVLSATSGFLDLPIGTTYNGTNIEEYIENLKGTIYADDSTVLVDAQGGGRINLNGTVKGDIVPDVSETYDIGTLTKKVKTLYVAETNGLYVGNAALSASGTSLTLPAGTTIAGTPIGTGGVVIGTNYNIGILADDTSLMVNTTLKTFNGDLTGNVTGTASYASQVALQAGGTTNADYAIPYATGLSGNQVLYTDTALAFNPNTNRLTVGQVLASNGFTGNLTGNVTGNVSGDLTGNVTGNVQGNLQGNVTGNVIGNVTGNVNGDIRGSIFSDGSTMLVDGVAGIIPAAVVSGNATALTGLTSAGTVVVTNDFATSSILVSGTYANNSDATGSLFTMRRARGTISSPTSVNTSDLISTIVAFGYDGSAYDGATSIASRVVGTISPGVVQGQLEFSTADATGALINRLTINNNGLITVTANTMIVRDTYSASTPMLQTQQFHTTADSININFVRGRGSYNVPGPIQNGDDIIDFGFVAYDGTSYLAAGGLSVTMSGAVSTGVVPAQMSISLNNGTSNADRFILGNDGTVDHKQTALVAGVGSGQVDTGSVAGYMRVKLNGVQYALPLYTINP